MAKSHLGVHLPTGKLSFPLPLTSLSGPNGFGAEVALNYSTYSLINKVRIWNQDSPTGQLGLGWSLDQPFIIRIGKGTLSDQFILGGSSGSPLILKKKDFVPEANCWRLCFVTKQHSLSKIIYTTDPGNMANSPETWGDNHRRWNRPYLRRLQRCHRLGGTLEWLHRGAARR